MRKWFFTSESVTEGHPDKICNQIADGILDAIMARGPLGRVACEISVSLDWCWLHFGRDNLNLPWEKIDKADK